MQNSRHIVGRAERLSDHRLPSTLAADLQLLQGRREMKWTLRLKESGSIERSKRGGRRNLQFMGASRRFRVSFYMFPLGNSGQMHHGLP